MCPLDLASYRKYINLYEVEALLNVPGEHFPLNVFGNSKQNSFWGVKVIASEKKKIKSQFFERLNSVHEHLLFNDWEIPVQEKSFLWQKLGHSGLNCPYALWFLLYVPCFVTRGYWKDNPSVDIHCFQSMLQSESYLSSETAKPVQETEITEVLSQ